MKRKMLLLAVVSLLLGLFAHAIAFAESMEYCDLVDHLIASWNQNVSRDELTALYGEPFSQAETYMSFWDKEKGTQFTYHFSEGLLTSIHVSYSVSSKAYWLTAYTIYVDTENKLNETLGKRQGFLYFYNSDEYIASNVDCIVGSWRCNEINILVSYNQLDTKISVFTQIAAAP